MSWVQFCSRSSWVAISGSFSPTSMLSRAVRQRPISLGATAFPSIRRSLPRPVGHSKGLVAVGDLGEAALREKLAGELTVATVASGKGEAPGPASESCLYSLLLPSSGLCNLASVNPKVWFNCFELDSKTPCLERGLDLLAEERV